MKGKGHQMEETIHDRGRGPEIKGTRITVYRIMDFVRDNAPPDEIARELRLSLAQVQVALDYIAAHREEVEVEYERILARPRKNPDWVDAILSKSPEELKQRILARAAKDTVHADHGGQ
jgi:uncharacterized protein (DUF433 family)